MKPTPIPSDADIAVYYYIEKKWEYSLGYEIEVLVENLTDDVLTIDQTKSFFVNSDRKSTAYYDPTIRTSSHTHTEGTSKGGSFNLGGLASALGIGGIAGTLMNATTLGKSNMSSNTSTYTEVMADLPKVSIGPRGTMLMSKSFLINVPSMNTQSLDMDQSDSPLKFSVSISYSFDDGQTTDLITEDFFCNAFIVEPVYKRKTNDAVRNMLKKKPNATLEPWFELKSNRGDKIKNTGVFYNYK